jgi:MerR family transcriptional regulator, light-induced transcriptional regulator
MITRPRHPYTERTYAKWFWDWVSTQTMPRNKLEVEIPLKTSEVSSLIGVPVPTIRSWERRYGWPSPRRTDGGHRRYTAEEVKQLRLLRDEVTAGRSAQQAVVLLRRLAMRRKKEYSDRLVAGALALDEQHIRAALEEASSTLTIEQTIDGVVLPALKEIGTKWERGICDVAGEHLASARIRLWLGDVLEQSRPITTARTLVVSTGPADFHSIGLEAFSVFLARRGWNPLVLGALTPVASLVEAVRRLNADGAVVVCHLGVTRRAALESIRAVAALPGADVYYAGNGFAAARARRGVPGTYLGTDMAAASDHITREREKAQ